MILPPSALMSVPRNVTSLACAASCAAATTYCRSGGNRIGAVGRQQPVGAGELDERDGDPAVLAFAPAGQQALRQRGRQVAFQVKAGDIANAADRTRRYLGSRRPVGTPVP